MSLLILRFVFILLTVAETCAEGEVWSDCVQCERTCQNLHLQCRSTECTEGCACPAGTVLDNGKCIPEGDCPCYHAGKSYGYLDVITKDCNDW